jgi:hypothetical protein
LKSVPSYQDWRMSKEEIEIPTMAINIPAT